MSKSKTSLHSIGTEQWIHSILADNIFPDTKSSTTSLNSSSKPSTGIGEKRWISSLTEALVLQAGDNAEVENEEEPLEHEGPMAPLEDLKSTKKPVDKDKDRRLSNVIEPYMEPLKHWKRAMMKDRKKMALSPAKLREREERKRKKQTDACQSRAWICECFPDVTNPFAPKPPLPQEPCVCFGPEPIKPGPAAGYLGMGYPSPRVQGPEFKRMPGTKLVTDELPNYSVTSFGRGLIPPQDKDAQPDDPSVIVHSFLLTGENGFQVEVSQLGARIVSIRAPDQTGKVEDVVLGFDRPKDYLDNQELYWGGIVGRVADRVRGPKPQLYVPGYGYALLGENDEPDYNMGGASSFDRQLWEAYVSPSGVLFTLVSRGGSDGFPGNVVTSVLYSVKPVNRLEVHIEAMTSAATPLALSLPLVFNLGGHDGGEQKLLEHILGVAADKYYTTKRQKKDKEPSELVISGKKKNVGNTIYDFRIPRQIKKMLKHAPDESYNNFLAASEYDPNDEDPKRLALLYHPKSKRMLEMWSTHQVLQISTRLGLPVSKHEIPDPNPLGQVRAILEHLIREVPKTTWDVFDWVKEKDEVAGGDRRRARAVKAATEAEAQDESAPPSSFGDHLPTHPGLRVLPIRDRGPTKAPFDSHTMDVLRKGGMKGVIENPVGYVEPGMSEYGEDSEFEERIKKDIEVKKRRTLSGGNLKPSNVGTVPRRSKSAESSFNPNDAKKLKNESTISGMIRAGVGSISPRTLQELQQPRADEFPAVDVEDSLDRVMKRHEPHEASAVNEETLPHTKAAKRLRAGADDSYDGRGYGDDQNYQPPTQGQYPQQGYEQYPQQGYEQYPQQGYEQYPQQGYEQYPQQGYEQYPQQGYEQYPQQGYEQYPSSGYDQRQYEQYPQRGYEQYDQYPSRGYDQQPQASRQYEKQDTSARYPKDKGEDRHSDDQRKSTRVRDFPYKSVSMYTGLSLRPRSTAAKQAAKWAVDRPVSPIIGGWPGTRYDRLSFGVPSNLEEPLRGGENYQRTGLGSILRGIGMVRSSMNLADRRRSEPGIVYRKDLRTPSALALIDLDNVDVDPPKPPDRLSNINLLATRLEGMHLDDLPQEKVPDVVRYLYAKPTPKDWEEKLTDKDIKGAIANLLDSILAGIKTPPKTYHGFNTAEYDHNAGILLVPQKEPLFGDKSNTDTFILRPGQRYKQTTIYAFGIHEKKPRKKKRPAMGKHRAIKDDEDIDNTAFALTDHCSVVMSLVGKPSETFSYLIDGCSMKSPHSSLASI